MYIYIYNMQIASRLDRVWLGISSAQLRGPNLSLARTASADKASVAPRKLSMIYYIII